jgi:hypothetical protein
MTALEQILLLLPHAVEESKKEWGEDWPKVEGRGLTHDIGTPVPCWESKLLESIRAGL